MINTGFDTGTVKYRYMRKAKLVEAILKFRFDR